MTDPTESPWLNRCHFGDVRAVLRSMIDAGVQVQTIVTSPPYFGLRSYLPDDHPEKALEIGLEPTPQAFVANLVEVFRLAREVLTDDGTLWLNIGDSYAGSGRGGYPGAAGTLRGTTAGQDNSRMAAAYGRSRAPTVRGNRIPAGFHASAVDAGQTGRAWVPAPVGLKNKDLIGIPWMLAFALRADGAACPAHMRDVEAMIAAVTASYDSREEWPDRLAALVERLQREHIDANRGGWYLRQDIIWQKPNPMPESVTDRCTKAHEYVFLLSKSPSYYCDMEAIAERASGDPDAPRNRWDRADYEVPGQKPQKRASRSGNLERKPRPGIPGDSRHQQGSVPWEGSTRNKRSVWTVATTPYAGSHFATFPPALIEPCVLAGAPAGGVVLDPFFGSGTTGQVAQQLGRQFIGIDINQANAPLQLERLRQPPLALEAAEEPCMPMLWDQQP